MDLSVVYKYLPVILVLIQIIGFVVLYVNTNKMQADPNAQQYYNTNVTAAVFVSLPIFFAVLSYMGIIKLDSSVLSVK